MEFLSSIKFLSNYSTEELIFKVAISLIILIVFLIFKRALTKLVINIISKLFKKQKGEEWSSIQFLKRPLEDFFIVTGIFLAVYNLPISGSVKVFAFFLFRLATIVLGTWILLNLCHPKSIIFAGLEKRLNPDAAKTITPFLANILKFLIVFISVAVIISECGYDISGFVAGLGLTSLAFALAAQDTAANIIGGAVVILDRPFSVGDWIQTPSVEGVVEDISFRSTRIRTFDDAIVSIPNSTITNEPITNWSKMDNRKISFSIGLTYQTSKEKIEKCVTEIKEMLISHEKVDKNVISVIFNQFSDSSLDINIHFFTKEKAFIEYMEVKEDINYRIMKIVEDNKAEFAYPTQTLYIENGDK